jgi:hypothetical protein
MIRTKEIRSTDSVKFTVIVMYYLLQYNGKHHTPTPSCTLATIFPRRTITLRTRFNGIIRAFTNP